MISDPYRAGDAAAPSRGEGIDAAIHRVLLPRRTQGLDAAPHGGKGDGTDPVDLSEQGWAERSALLDHKFVTMRATHGFSSNLHSMRSIEKAHIHVNYFFTRTL